MKSPVRNAWLALLLALFAAACQDATAPATDRSAPDAPLADHDDDDDGDDGDDDGKRVTCRNQVLTGTLPGVFIPQGASCWIVNAVVENGVRGDRPENVEVRRSTVRDGIRIKGGGRFGAYVNIWDQTVVAKGNVTITDREGGSIALIQSRVERGNVSMKRNVATHSIWIGETAVERNVIVVQNFTPAGSRLLIEGNQIDQNLLVIQNRGNAGKQVQFNTVRQTIECVHNDEPFAGTPNAARRAHGQCSASGGGRR